MAATFKASFTCDDASVYTAAAVCLLRDGASNMVKLTAIGKFPYLSLEETDIDHGDVLVGRDTQRSVRMANHSLVPANFEVRRSPGPSDGVFSLAPMRGTLGAGQWMELKVGFVPRAAGTFSSEGFEIGTPGGNRLTLRQRGTALGAVVALSERAMNFGSTALGTSVRKVCSLPPLHPAPHVHIQPAS